MGKYMDICVGGPWHGSKFLITSSQKSEWFKAKDQCGKTTTYNKKIIKVGTKRLTFWIDSELTTDQVIELLEDLLRIKLSVSCLEI